MRRDQLAIAVKSAKLAREAGLSVDGTDIDDPSIEQIEQRVELAAEIDEGVRQQLAVLLLDDDDERPSEAFLAEHLDSRVAAKLLSWLLEDLTPGEETPTTTPAATGA